MAAIGIAPDDDDGNAASKPPPPLPTEKPKPVSKPKTASNEQERAAIESKPKDAPAAPTTKPKAVGKPDRIYNDAPGSLTEMQVKAIENVAKDKGIDLAGYLEPRVLGALSEKSAAEVYFELKAMK
jgi:hypothetical protein